MSPTNPSTRRVRRRVLSRVKSGCCTASPPMEHVEVHAEYAKSTRRVRARDDGSTITKSPQLPPLPLGTRLRLLQLIHGQNLLRRLLLLEHLGNHCSNFFSISYLGCGPLCTLAPPVSFLIRCRGIWERVRVWRVCYLGKE